MTAARLQGKVALVTGAASGIGRAVALAFAGHGATVYFADRDFEGASRAAALAPSASGRALRIDIADEESVWAAYATVLSRHEALDVVVANAGVQFFGEDAPIGDLELAVWRRTIDINLTGTFLTVKHAVRVLRSGGSIIVTGSPTGITGEGAGFTAYSTSKAGIHGLVRTAAADYAKAGIRINSVIPGFTGTPMTASLTSDAHVAKQVVSRVALRRAGTPEDVTGIMVYLASDESSYATGSMFVVDGGMTSL